MPANPKPQRWSSKKYEAWAKTLPCCLCHASGPSECHHMKGKGNMSGVGLRAPSWASMPLCRSCHDYVQKVAPAQQWEFVARTLGRAIEEGILKM